jgi:polyisoprenoid-binding protein YceI
MGKALGIAGTLLAVAGLIWYFFYAQGVPGFWVLNSEESFFHFSSVKNGDISEQHTLTSLVGEASFTGKIVVRLDLTSLDTGIDIRDQRMREFLFEVEKFPVARIEADYDLAVFGEIAPGETQIIAMPFTLKLHGIEKQMEISVTVYRSEWNKVIITPTEDLIIDAADFNLEEGINTLKSLAGLNDISTRVPVTFKLVFEGATTPNS